MKEQYPENPKNNAPEPAAGPLGIPPPPATEQAAQGSKSPKLDLPRQSEEGASAQRGRESTRAQLARARRLDYRRQFQTRPPVPPEFIRPLEDPLIEEAETIVILKQYEEMEGQKLAHTTPQEEMDNLKESRTMTMKINYAKHLKSDMLDKMQRLDPEFMTPIFEGLKKRQARQAKAERAIQRRGINPGIDDYLPLWER